MKRFISLLNVRSRRSITILAVIILLLGISSGSYGDTWTQVNEDGFGDVNNTDCNLIVFNDYLYAATDNTPGIEIWRSSDGTNWTQVKEYPDETWESEGDFIIFQNQLYHLAGKDNAGGEVWRTTDGTTWEQVNIDGFGDSNNKAFSAQLFFDYNFLYVLTENAVTGIEIWRSSDGTTWEQVNVDGFGNINNIGGAFKVFNFNLYVSTENNNTGVEVWRSSNENDWIQGNQDGFGDPDNVHADMSIFQCYLYAATSNNVTGIEVWRTPDGTTWEQVNEAGFGDPNNNEISRSGAFGSYLYMSTGNSATGAEMWRTQDGTTWEQVNEDGFGNSDNYEISDNIIFGSYLYVSANNTEVWKTSDGTSWVLSNSRGFGDANNSRAGFTIFGNYLYASASNTTTGVEIWRTSLPASTSRYEGNIEWRSADFGEADGVDVADVDGDGKPEIITIVSGSVRVFAHDGATYQEEWTSDGLANAVGDAAIGDVDGDGILEIIASTRDAGNIYIYVFGFDGSNYQLEWQSGLFSGDGYDGLNLFVGDTDGDGLLEIVAMSDYIDKSYIWIYEYDGATYQQVWESGFLEELAGLEMADIDGDGIQEMVFDSYEIIIIGYDGTDYQIEWQSEFLYGLEGFEMGDVDADGALELVVFFAGSNNNNIQIYKFDGQTYNIVWQNCDFVDWSQGRIGDVDGDGIKEIVGSWNGEVHIYGYDGTTWQLEWQTVTPSPSVRIEEIADFDQDGNLEILVQEETDEDSSDDTYYRSVYEYDGSTYQLKWRDLKINSYFNGLLGPAGDVDNDGIIEEVRVAYNEAYDFSIYVIGPLASPSLDIKANGSDASVSINTSDNLSITVELDSGDYMGEDADWWVAESAPDGWYYYNLSTSWTSAGSSYDNLIPTYQGALFDLSTYEVLNTSGLSEGTHTYYFAIDTNMDGNLDLDQIYYDSVEVNVTQ